MHRIERLNSLARFVHRSTLAPLSRQRWARWLVILVGLGWLGLTASLYGGAHGGAVPMAALAEPADLESLLDRAGSALDALETAERVYDREVAPIERVLLSYRDDPELARRIAVALVREANLVQVEPRLLLAVLLVENPWLDPKARSFVGATGLMQVMPGHRGNWRPCGDDLVDVETNICYGARIFASYFRATGGDVERALLRYNGCVRGTNTPNCHSYPYHVYARAGRASILAWLEPQPGGAAAP
jgi:soluble lytic murein transglycosylase-like protein